MIAKVALKIPYADPYDYLVPEELASGIRPGIRALVPLGTRKVAGVVISIAADSAQPGLKPLVRIIDPAPLYSPKLLQFCQWISSYYICSLGEVLDAALPSKLIPKIEKRLNIDKNSIWEKLPENEKSALIALQNKTKSQILKKEPAFEEKYAPLLAKKILKYNDFLSISETRANQETRVRLIEPNVKVRAGSKAALILDILREKKEIARADLEKEVAGASAPLRRLKTEKVVETIKKPKNVSLFKEPYRLEPFLDLNPEQSSAFQKIEISIKIQRFQTFLLFGITGSGKTEIYLHAVRRTLEQNKQTLVLLPEIALTPQTVSRFRNRFADNVAVLHSGMKDWERSNHWRKIKNKECSVVIGTRSAIFAPLDNLGLIVVDEEHDSSFKQNESPHYNARDCAVKLGKDRNCPVILGSATPSVESYQNCEEGKYSRLTLSARASKGELPQIEVVNLKHEPREPGAFYLSKALIRDLREIYGQKKQAIVFLNRRGYAAFLSCAQCESPVLCENCSIALTWHRVSGRLECHHCGFSTAPGKPCKSCGNKEFTKEGIGTQRVERDMKALFPKGRFLRLDRDTVTKTGALEEYLSDIREHRVDFIIGTQLVSKGHDFQDIGLVCVILADMTLNIPDFRSSERTYQLLTQVAGRSGRGSGKAKTLIQSYNPSHFSIRFAKSGDFSSFFFKELKIRESLQNPPFFRLISIRVSGENEKNTLKSATALAQALRKSATSETICIQGPVESPVYRMNNRYFQQLLLKSSNGLKLRKFCGNFFRGKKGWRAGKGVRVKIDVDPYFF